jgi:GTP-binding protein Era
MEQSHRLIDDEIPHGIAVSNDRMKRDLSRDKVGMIDIEQLVCERETHKGIIIGKAQLLKRSEQCQTEIKITGLQSNLSSERLKRIGETATF